MINVSDHLGLAGRITSHYVRRNPRLARHSEDIYQEAVVGLCHAAKKFNASKAGFATYANYWMDAYIIKYLLHIASPVYHPASVRVADVEVQTADADALADVLPANAPDPDDIVFARQCIERLQAMSSWDGLTPRNADMFCRYVAASFDYEPANGFSADAGFRVVRAPDGSLVLQTLGEEFGLCKQAVRNNLNDVAEEMKAWANAA